MQANRPGMAEQDEKPWWRQMYGLPPSRDLPDADTRNGRFARAVLRHPARYGWSLGAFMGVCWTLSFRFAMDAQTSTAVLLGSGFGIFWGVMQTELTKAQARQQGIRIDE